MSRRQLLAALLGLIVAAGFIRLGMWQVSRLRSRQVQNMLLSARLYAPESPPFGLIAGTRQWRRVIVTGTFDFDHQIVLAGRAHDGSPGVYILTPLKPDAPAPPILINRGWVYSADAQNVDLSKFDEDPHQTIHAWVGEFVYNDTSPARTASTPYAWRRLDASQLPSAFPYPVAPFYLVALQDSGVTAPPSAPARLSLPTPDEGPHRNYAIFWFSSALIALVGTGVIIWRDRTAARGKT